MATVLFNATLGYIELHGILTISTISFHCTADPGRTTFILNNVKLSANKRFSGPSHGNVTCSTSWHTADVEITLTSTYGTKMTRGEHVADCIYNATVMQYYDLSYGEKEIFTCNATHGGIISVESRKLSGKKIQSNMI